MKWQKWLILKCTMSSKYSHYEVRALSNESSDLQVCVDWFGGDLLSSRVQARQFLSR